MAWIFAPRRAWSKIVISTVLVVLYSAVVQADTNFSFPPGFPYQNNNSASIPEILGDALYSPDGLYKMNTNSVATGTLSVACGRVLYKDMVRMMDKVTRRAASFNTSFTFSFISKNGNFCGDGMVFSFYQGNSIGDREYNRSGRGFCVHNYTQPHERQFSVEIDAYMNSKPSNDFSDSHIGVNFGNENVSSRYDLCDSTAGHCTTEYDLCRNTTVKTNTLNNIGPLAVRCAYFCGDTKSTRNYTLWIDYDDEGHTLEVRFSPDGSFSMGTPKPALALITVPNFRLNEFLNEEVEMYYVGFTGSTGFSREVHALKSWDFVTTGLPDNIPAAERNQISLIAGTSCAAALTVALTLGFLWFVYKKRRTRRRPPRNQELLSFLEASDGLRRFTYRVISSSTKNFSASEFLSSGAFGDVYRGVLPSGALVAVKRIKENEGRGEESFLAEATSLTQIRHRNLLQLRGWSHNQAEMFLVYDYMSNGSLDKWIYQTCETDDVLSWDARRSILAGAAAGLEYLHTGWVQCVLHRDIKASNVLLDADFVAHLGDFGLARLIDHHKLEKTTLLAGTLGYMAPEMQSTGRATKETDVFAFGILVLEVVCGRRPLNVQLTDHPADIVLLESVWRAHEGGKILKVADTRLLESKPDGETSDMFVKKMNIMNVLHLGLLCCLPNPSERPSMRMVSQWFQAAEHAGTMELPHLPAYKPHHYISHYTGFSHESSSAAAGGSSSSQWSGSSSLSALPMPTEIASQWSGSSSLSALPMSTEIGSSVVAERFNEPGR